MSELDQYLDQICRSLGGPRSLRQHVRQELREHLLDAAAEHQATGLTQQQAIAKAIEDFGRPELVRSELQATHGHRLIAVVIDKAMQWKEKTMKAKWLWTSWAHFALALIIGLQAAFIITAILFIHPTHQMLAKDEYLIFPQEADSISWMHPFLADVAGAINNVFWWLIPLLLLWALFEWRVRSDNKTLIRLGIMGAIAVGLMVVVMLTAASLILPPTVAFPQVELNMPQRAHTKMSQLRSATKSLDETLAAGTKDWTAMQRDCDRALDVIRVLRRIAYSAESLTPGRHNEASKDRVIVSDASNHLVEMRAAIELKDAARAREALGNYNQTITRLFTPAPTTKPLP
jgi:hypothetical protein